MSGIQLLQIEEPTERPEEPEDPGLPIGLELTDTGLRIAASVGGNAELVRGAEGALDFLPAIAGYDADGNLIAGEAGLADETRIGRAALADPDSIDARGSSVADRVAALVDTSRRRLMMLTRRPAGPAIVLVPLDADASWRMALMQAVEAGGIEVLRLVEESVALAIGGGLGRQGDGSYLHVKRLPHGVALARLDCTQGAIRLSGGALAADAAGLAALIESEGPVAGIIAPALGDFAMPQDVPLLAGFDGETLALIGAALLAEALSAEP